MIRLVGGSVPVPDRCYVEGPTFRELVKSARSEELAEAAHSAGETLAVIGLITLANPGWLAPGPAVTDSLLQGADPMPRFVGKLPQLGDMNSAHASPTDDLRISLGERPV